MSDQKKREEIRRRALNQCFGCNAEHEFTRETCPAWTEEWAEWRRRQKVVDADPHYSRAHAATQLFLEAMMDMEEAHKALGIEPSETWQSARWDFLSVNLKAVRAVAAAVPEPAVAP